MSNNPTVGSAFVEVHARAAQNLEGEMRVETERAAKRVQATLPAPASAGSASVRRAEAAHGAGSQEALAAQQAFEERGAAFSQRLAAQRAAAQEKAEQKIRKQVHDTADEQERAGRRAAKSTSDTTASLLQGAGAYFVVDRAVRAVTATVGAFIKAGDEGRLKSEADVRAYRELANGIDELGTSWEEAKEKIGGFIATDINPFSDKFRKGLEASNHPLATLNLFLGRNTKGVRDLADAFAAIDAETPSDTIAETARAVDKLTESNARYAKEFDARVDAQVRAVGIQVDQLGANERLWRAQEKVNEVTAKGAEVTRRLADAERAVHEAREAAADAAQNAIDRDRALEEARRDLAETSFRTGSQSQATKDAADAVQKAEFDATRAHEEAGDAVADVAKAERDAADVRITANRDLAQAESDLQDAQRESAKVQADLQVAQREAAGETVSATEKLQAYLDELDKFEGKGAKIQAEIDIVKAALASLPSASGVDQATQAALNALGPAYNQGYAPGFTPSAAQPAPGDPQHLTLGPGMPSVTVYLSNTYNTPVDPAQVAREQASQIGGSAFQRVI